jgi:hypothetical protein
MNGGKFEQWLKQSLTRFTGQKTKLSGSSSPKNKIIKKKWWMKKKAKIQKQGLRVNVWGMKTDGRECYPTNQSL